MRANRNDKHHADVVKAFRLLHCSVQSLTRVKDGCPDILVGIAGRNEIIEIKTENEKPRENQLNWHNSWLGKKPIVLSVPESANFDDIVSLCKAVMKWR